MTEQVIADAKNRMQKSIEALHNDLSRLRTGRAHPSLLEPIMVNNYGADMPLNQVASISVESARCLAVTPWDKNLVASVEKAIVAADLGLNPSTAGTVIRVPLPALTEESRRNLTKLVREEGEKARVSVRNARRDANTSVTAFLKDKEITEDDEHRAEATIQKLTDDFVKEIDGVIESKEKDLMEV